MPWPLSPASPGLSSTFSSQILPSYPTLPPLGGTPTLLPGSLSLGAQMTPVLTHSFSHDPWAGLVGLPVAPLLTHLDLSITRMATC